MPGYGGNAEMDAADHFEVLRQTGLTVKGGGQFVPPILIAKLNVLMYNDDAWKFRLCAFVLALHQL